MLENSGLYLNKLNNDVPKILFDMNKVVVRT